MLTSRLAGQRNETGDLRQDRFGVGIAMQDGILRPFLQRDHEGNTHPRTIRPTSMGRNGAVADQIAGIGFRHRLPDFGRGSSIVDSLLFVDWRWSPCRSFIRAAGSNLIGQWTSNGRGRPRGTCSTMPEWLQEVQTTGRKGRSSEDIRVAIGDRAGWLGMIWSLERRPMRLSIGEDSSDMSKATLSAEVMEALGRIDSPTVANAIEHFKVRDRVAGFASLEARCQFPDLAPMVGYAVTCIADSTAAGDSRPWGLHEPPGCRQ